MSSKMVSVMMRGLLPTSASRCYHSKVDYTGSSMDANTAFQLDRYSRWYWQHSVCQCVNDSSPKVYPSRNINKASTGPRQDCQPARVFPIPQERNPHQIGQHDQRAPTSTARPQEAKGMLADSQWLHQQLQVSSLSQHYVLRLRIFTYITIIFLWAGKC